MHRIISQTSAGRSLAGFTLMMLAAFVAVASVLAPSATAQTKSSRPKAGAVRACRSSRPRSRFPTCGLTAR